MVREGWSGIDVQLKRRTDLIPNLVETVKGYATHERSLFEEIAVAARGAASRAGDVGDARPTPSARSSGSLGKLMAVAEAYPELKANQNFLELQNQLAGDRGPHPDGAPLLQRRRAQPEHQHPVVPGRDRGATLGFREEPFFELESRAEAAAPQIGFPGGMA